MAFDLSKLGVKKNIPQVSFFEYSGLMIAPPKFGKTTLATLIPKSITCAFELGYSGQVTDAIDIETWEDFIKFIDNLQKNRKEIGNDIKIIAMDTVNRAYEMCGDYTLRELARLATKKDKKGNLIVVKYNKPQDVPHGQFYSERDKFFSKQLNRLISLGFKPFFTTHSEIKTVTPKVEEGQPEQPSYDIYSTTMDKRCEKIIMPLVDYILYGKRIKTTDEIGNITSTRVLTSKGDTDVVAGNRVYIEEDIQFETEEEAIEKFQECFGAVIQERLIKAGIMDDIKDIEKKQEEAKEKEINAYVDKEEKQVVEKEQKVEPVEDTKSLINEITRLFKEATKDQKLGVKNILNGTKLVDADVNTLKKILADVFNVEQ